MAATRSTTSTAGELPRSRRKRLVTDQALFSMHLAPFDIVVITAITLTQRAAWSGRAANKTDLWVTNCKRSHGRNNQTVSETATIRNRKKSNIQITDRKLHTPGHALSNTDGGLERCRSKRAGQRAPRSASTRDQFVTAIRVDCMLCLSRRPGDLTLDGNRARITCAAVRYSSGRFRYGKFHVLHDKG